MADDNIVLCKLSRRARRLSAATARDTTRRAASHISITVLKQAHSHRQCESINSTLFMIQSFAFIGLVRASERASFSDNKKIQTTLYIAYEK